MLTRDDFLWDDYFWNTTVSLSSVIGSKTCFGPYAEKHDALQSESQIELTVESQNEPKTPLTDSELGRANWFLEHGAEVVEAAINGLYAAYADLQIEYEYTDEEKVEYRPDIDSVDDIRSMIGLRSVCIHKFAKDNLPYIGLEFKCLWDNEHMAGVMLNGTRVVEAGGGDTAFLEWIAERDTNNEA